MQGFNVFEAKTMLRNASNYYIQRRFKLVYIVVAVANSHCDVFCLIKLPQFTFYFKQCCGWQPENTNWID